MLGNNQYLSEYLSPLPTTLDAKKSPLALLAQTCSNIGADNPNNKPVLSGLEKSKTPSGDSKKGKSPVIISDDHSDSAPKATPTTTSFKPYESTITRKDENGSKTPSSKTSSPLVIPSRRSPASNSGKSSPANSEHLKTESQDNPPSSSSSSCSTQNTLSGLGYGGLDVSRSDSTKENHLSLGLNAFKSSINPMSGCCPSGPMDLHGSSLLKPGGYPLGSPLSPFVGYARVKTAAGGTTLVPVCRDPYCTNCQFSMHNAQLAACPSGCTQCSHERLAAPLPGLSHGMMPGLTGSAAAMAAVAAAAGGVPYPHSLLSRPNVCSWMVGDTFCGKRFSTSDELFQHLRTHTSMPVSESPLSLMSPFSLASSHLHYSSPLTSPAAGLRRTYPTSVSPVGPLSASRFHPYKPLSTLPGAPIPQLGHPGLGMYYPYGLYGQRLGPPVHP